LDDRVVCLACHSFLSDSEKRTRVRAVRRTGH
jgi:hypothetical protein